MTPHDVYTSSPHGLEVVGLELWAEAASTGSQSLAPASTAFTFLPSSTDTWYSLEVTNSPFSDTQEVASSENTPSAFELANRDRIELLAKRFVEGVLDREHAARLAIAERVVDTLVPVAVESDFEQLSKIRERAEKLGRESDEEWTRLAR